MMEWKGAAGQCGFVCLRLRAAYAGGTFMELRQLRSFIAAAEERNISRAAQRLNLTQPALSRQIKGLEEEMGVALLERGAHSFTLTAAGEMLLREGKGLIERADALVERLQGTTRTQTLRVGYSPTLTAGILAPAMEVFTQRHPKARVELSDSTSCEMVERLQKGELDVIVTVRPEREMANVSWETVQLEKWCVVVPRQHALAAKNVLGPKDLDGQKLVVYNQKEYPEYWGAIAGWFKKQGINAKIASECDGVNSLISAVEAGLGVALVVERIACLLPERVILKPMKPQPPAACIAAGMQEKRQGEAVLAVFVEELKRAGTAAG
ncbi:MAG TPA: LysR family transcriptional regulator [Prosthecobacter sp.]|nr:LysR family transcriptional regulator [Prosthecobacter sp.]